MGASNRFHLHTKFDIRRMVGNFLIRFTRSLEHPRSNYEDGITERAAGAACELHASPKFRAMM